MARVNYRTHTVVVTGASSGIGRSFAEALAARGANVVLVARRHDRLEMLSEHLKAEHGVGVTIVPLDLATPSAAGDLQNSLEEAGIAATALINNAGFGTYGQFIDEDSTMLAREIAVDVGAPVHLTSALLPDIVKAQGGFIINVASMAAYAPAPRMAVYGAAKAFVLSFTEALWAELRPTGTTVFVVSPGATSTEFNDVVGTDDATGNARKRSPEGVVATALGHLERRNPGPSVVDGASNRLASHLGRVMTRRALVGFVERATDPERMRRRRARRDQPQ